MWTDLRVNNSWMPILREATILSWVLSPGAPPASHNQDYRKILSLAGGMETVTILNYVQGKKCHFEIFPEEK